MAGLWLDYLVSFNSILQKCIETIVIVTARQCAEEFNPIKQWEQYYISHAFPDEDTEAKTPAQHYTADT